MLKIIRQPYNILFLFSMLLIMASYLQPNGSIDFHLRDTYFVAGTRYIFWMLAMISFLICTIYLATAKILYSRSLSWVHTIVTMATLIFFIVIMNTDIFVINPGARRYLNYSDRNSFNSLHKTETMMAVVCWLLLAGQIILPINLVAGIFKRLRQ